MFSTIEDKSYGDDCYDYIYLRNLHLTATIGKDAWERAGKPQPVIVTLRLQRRVSRAAASDNIEDTVSYGQICKDVMSRVEAQKEYADLLDFSMDMHILAVTKKWCGTSLHIRTMLPKGSLRAEGGIGLEAAGTPGEPGVLVDSSMKFLVQDLRIPCIIGVNAHERLAKQTVVVNLQITEDQSRDFELPGSHHEHWEGLTREVVQVSLLQSRAYLDDRKLTDPPLLQTVEISTYQTLEALADDIATVSCTRWAASPVTVSVEKPSALAFVDGAGVQITRAFRNGIVS